MLRLEHGRWWNTRRWLVQSAVWLLLLNGIVAMNLYFNSGVIVVDSGSPPPVLPPPVLPTQWDCSSSSWGR
jgi:hypothetical protein